MGRDVAADAAQEDRGQAAAAAAAHDEQVRAVFFGFFEDCRARTADVGDEVDVDAVFMVGYGGFAQVKDAVSALAQAVGQVFEAAFFLVQCRFFSDEVAHVGDVEDRDRCAVGFGEFYGVADGFQ